MSRTRSGLLHALNILFPGTGPGGYFGNGSTISSLDEEAKGINLINQIARTMIRSWIEVELGSEFGIERRGVRPSVQFEMKPNRSLPTASIKWNKVTDGTTTPLRIEEATVRYLGIRIPGWGNNRSPNNDYVEGSTKSEGFHTPLKVVYFDHLTRSGGVPLAGEAFTGPLPGARDIEAWVYLSRQGCVRPGRIFNFQNELGQSVSEATTSSLVAAGFQVSVVPYKWWSLYLSEAFYAEFVSGFAYVTNEHSHLQLFYPLIVGPG